jgi:hypothetical protein
MSINAPGRGHDALHAPCVATTTHGDHRRRLRVRAEGSRASLQGGFPAVGPRAGRNTQREQSI